MLLSMLVIILAWIPMTLSGNIICTNETGECQHSTIDCVSGESCSVFCNGNRGCYGSRINCPTSATCNVYCNGNHGCYLADINCPTNGRCNVYCNGDRICDFPKSIFLRNWPQIRDVFADNCPIKGACNLDCAGNYGCYFSNINCISMELTKINGIT